MVDGLRLMGSYSGIDMSMVEQLMEAERARGSRFTRQKETYERQQNAWKDLNTRLDNLYTRLESLTKPEAFQSKKVTVTGDDKVSVSANTDAAVGSYRVHVERLASQTRLTGSRVESVDSIHDSLGATGTLTLGGQDEAIEIDVTSKDSLRDVSDKINAQSSESGIKASVVDNRLILQSVEYGDQTFSVSGTVAGNLGLTGAELEIGKTAQFLVDGLLIERDSNQIDDVIEGLTFSLQNVHEENESDTIRITDNVDKAAEELQKLVEQYNSTQSYIQTQLDVGDPSAENNQTGTLVGDSAIMRLQSELRSLFSRPQATSSESIRTLGDLGVEIDRDGVATFNRETFTEKMEESAEEVQKFFHDTRRIQEVSENEEGEEVSRTRDERFGFAHDARELINQYISSTSGIIQTRTETYDRMIRDTNDRIDTFNERMERRQERMIRQFTALDTAMMQAETQMNQLFSQLDSSGM